MALNNFFYSDFSFHFLYVNTNYILHNETEIDVDAGMAIKINKQTIFFLKD